MAFRLATPTQNAADQALVTFVDYGTTNTTARILIFTGSQPANPQTAATGTQLATVNLNNPSFGSASNGTATMITTTPVTNTVDVTGTPGWFRVINRAGNPVFDGTVGATGSGADMTFDNINFVAGGIVTVNSMTVTINM